MGRSWAFLGLSWVCPRSVLGLSWVVLGPAWVCLRSLGPVLGCLVALLNSLGALLGSLGAHLDSLGALLSSLGALLGSLGHTWGSLGLSWASLGRKYAPRRDESVLLGFSWAKICTASRRERPFFENTHRVETGTPSGKRSGGRPAPPVTPLGTLLIIPLEPFICTSC